MTYGRNDVLHPHFSVYIVSGKILEYWVTPSWFLSVCVTLFRRLRDSLYTVPMVLLVVSVVDQVRQGSYKNLRDIECCILPIYSKVEYLQETKLFKGL